MHKINEKRIRRLSPSSRAQTETGPVLYFMDRDRRLKDNWALLHAQNLALEKNTPLHILYVMPHDFLGSTWRQHHFMIEGFKEIELKAEKLGIHFEVLVGEPVKEVKRHIKKHEISHLVTDFTPLRLPRSWREALKKELQIPFDEVDAHNVVPCWEASPKKEFAAYTFRPKVTKMLTEYLTQFPKLKKHPHPAQPLKNDWEALISSLKIDKSVKPVDWIKPGEKAAHKMLKDFLEKKIANYAEDRNDPNLNALSNLSPYLHYGQIAAQRVAFEVEMHAAQHAKVFLEELIVRREVAENFCYYEKNYDNEKGFHEWAQKTLNEHKEDPREYLYTLKEFDEAKTHDELWNAAQRELLNTGKMHGFMRMYWAKKILEWTKSPQQAIDIAINLNDRYELDGRDPNGYTGIAWSIGGVHDRAWTERPVFGKIRFMNFNGCKRKFDVKSYIASHSGTQTLL